MTDVDRQLSRSAELLERVSAENRQGRGKRRRNRDTGIRVRRILIAWGVIISLAVAIGWVTPIGVMGFFAVLLALAAATILFALLPAEATVGPEQLAQVDLKALPRQTERWLEAQRFALPAPAMQLTDQIGVKLEALGLQLQALDEREPAAAEIRRLVGEQLPELVKGYQRVPAGLRSTERNGKSPDAQLIDGLTLIDEEIGEMTAKLAEGDLNQLATRSRYLEIAYKEGI